MALLQTLQSLIVNIPSIIMGIFGIGFVIAFHEFGHFIFGKLFGVSIPEFSIGFGPRLISKKIGDTIFSLSLVPVGGYVAAETGDPIDPKPNTIEAKPYWQKMSIIGGGIFFNLIFAYAIFFGLSLTGIPGNPFLANESDHIIQQFSTETSPAKKSGLLVGDKIIKLNNVNVQKNIGSLLKELSSLADKQAQITVNRNGKEKTVLITIGAKTVKGKKVGSLEIGFGFEPIPPVPFTAAFKKAGNLLWSLVCSTFGGFRKAFSNRSTEGFAGPLMMISLSAQTAAQSIPLFLLLLAFISVSLAVLNVLPLPILDGGQALTYTIEAVIGKPIPEIIKERIHYTCWFVMIALFLYLTFKDVLTLWFG